MTEIPLSQGLVALVDDEDAERVMAAGKWSAGRSRKTFYGFRRMRRTDGQYVTMRLHTFVTGWPMVDHINENGLDNRRANLRETTNAENLRNRGRPRSNTSGYKGVTWHKQRNKWMAQIRADTRRYYLGLHNIPEEAARAYDEAARELHGEFARLNFPEVAAHG